MLQAEEWGGEAGGFWGGCWNGAVPGVCAAGQSPWQLIPSVPSSSFLRDVCSPSSVGVTPGTGDVFLCVRILLGPCFSVGTVMSGGAVVLEKGLEVPLVVGELLSPRRSPLTPLSLHR